MRDDEVTAKQRMVVEALAVETVFGRGGSGGDQWSFVLGN